MDELREKVAQKLYELAGYDELHIQAFPNKAWIKISEKAKGRWFIRADQILALIKEEGYKSAQEIELMYNPDYLDFQKGVEATRELFKGHVKLAENQELPPFVYFSQDDFIAKSTIQQDMLKAGWVRKVT